MTALRHVPAEVVAARALAKASKGSSLKGYLEKSYERLGIPDSLRPVIVALVSNVARRWMLLAKALGYPYERPRASFKFWLSLVVAYQALFRKQKPSKLSWAFKEFPKRDYVDLLRSSPEDFLRDLIPEERDRVYLSVPKWAWEDIKKITDPKEYVLSLDERKHFWVRIRKEGAEAELRRLGYEVEESPLPDVVKLRGPMRWLVRSKLAPSKVVIMELASATIAHLTKGRVLDLTSAPGGKALHARDLGRLVIANDLDPKRFAFGGLERVRSDARLPPFRKAFDALVLDPDCTGLGRLHSPETRIWVSMTSKHKMAEYQRQLIRSALDLLRKGSRIIYSTCTVTWEENEGHAGLFEGLEPVEVPYALPGRLPGWRRYLPNVHGTIGFTFVAYEL
ncbi:MAG: RsmB/NOP family class I SAM-dependent RNA methyltransferase [Crenarchaeota archaeon]|nr:RsmB/NOP family class I SAM-dependent RNA methyltransferase [Thermoproteota archaeon]